VGEVLGKYHPHGDSAVYEAMARMAQDFSLRCMLIDGQGNFGSVDGDPPAAMRYTEAKLALPALDILADINKDTVDFTANFDDTLTEPSVLPAALPNLLVNGATGIAVGMATSIPPHNLGEVTDALVYMLQNWEKIDDIDVERLMTFIQGPDFPTGGVIIQESGEDGIEAAYGSGRGKVRIQNDLVGRGATSRVTGAYFADGVQHLDYDTFQLHAAPDTTSDFAFKGALRDRASAVWRGMIRVEPDAQRTNAYQENRNLLLSKTAHADSIPGLEIMANDVRCTHGATLGQVDREQLFYLMSRGLPRHEAERLIVRGFFQDVLNRIELEPVRDALAHVLESRIPGA
jgi:hypothetical protein